MPGLSGWLEGTSVAACRNPRWVFTLPAREGDALCSGIDICPSEPFSRRNGLLAKLEHLYSKDIRHAAIGFGLCPPYQRDIFDLEQILWL